MHDDFGLSVTTPNAPCPDFLIPIAIYMLYGEDTIIKTRMRTRKYYGSGPVVVRDVRSSGLHRCGTQMVSIDPG